MRRSLLRIVACGLSVLVLAFLAVAALVWWLVPVSFCDIALVLDAAMDAGEEVYRAMEEFYSKVTEEMIANLPDDLRGLAEVLVAVVDGLLAGPRVLASLVFNVLDPPLDAMAAACRI